MNPPRDRLIKLASLVMCAALFAACGGGGDSTSEPNPELAAQPAYLPQNTDMSVEYVGQETCQACHFEVFGTTSGTGMGRAFYPMSPEVEVEDFTDDNMLVILESGLHYRMVERDGLYYQQQFMLDSSGAEVAFDERQLKWVIGSNNHSRSYVVEVDGKMFQAPICWYPDEELWELCPGYEFGNDHFGRAVTQGCIQCHNDVLVNVEGERNKYKQPYPLGIGCERCHGPGQLHVERWQAKDAVATGDPDPTIVHPRRLPKEERIEVCLQCHLGDARSSERVVRWDKDVSIFRPGQKITEMVVPFRYAQQTQWDFGLTAQADRLLQSTCYKESDGRIECLTCHNPHITVYHEQRPADFFRQRCLSCHATDDCIEEEAPRAATQNTADDCIECHMRVAEPDDQRFTTFTDHWIRRDINLDKRDRRDRFDVEPIFPDRFAALPEAEQAFYQARAESLLARDIPVRQQPPIWAEAEKNFKRAIELGFDNVHSQFFLAKILQNQQRWPEAHTALEAAHTHEPAHHDAAYALGQSFLRGGVPDKALPIFEAMLKLDGDDAMALAEMGRTLGLLGRVEEGLTYFNQALLAEPWQSELYINKGRLLAQLGRYGEAADLAQDGVELDPDSRDAWFFYFKAHEKAGRPVKAAMGRGFAERLANVAPGTGHSGM